MDTVMILTELIAVASMVVANYLGIIQVMD
jgi:hypothetical protein